MTTSLGARNVTAIACFLLFVAVTLAMRGFSQRRREG